MSVKVESISDRSVALGEGPHWDDRAQALYFISIPENTIHRYDAVTRVHTSTALEGKASFIVPLEGHLDHFLMGIEQEFAVVQWDGKEGSTAKIVRSLGKVDSGTTNKINDGKADPRGRIYAGTLDAGAGDFDSMQPRGTLYRLDERGITALCDKISASNGLAWDLDAKAMYYIDTMEKKIRRYDYDVETGDISNKQYHFDFEQNNVEGFPDGMTIDTNGNLWVAAFSSGCVVQISPKGELLQKVAIPAKQVTSCTFGGANLDELFVTTGNIDFLGEKSPGHPSGCTFKVTGLGVKGHPNVNFKL